MSSGWDRRRLLLILLAAGAAALMLGLGLGYAVHFAVSSTTHPSPSAVSGQGVTAAAADGQSGRDQVAAAPMFPASPEDSRGGEQARIAAPTILIPPAARSGPAQVPTGFPRTPEGALGQLAAIETTVLQAMSIPQAQAVYDGWAMPGGVGAASWEMTANVAAFLGKNNPGQAKAVTTTVVATPVGAHIKGVDGPDWVLACVLLHVRAVITSDAAIGYGHCERMQWVGGRQGRWMIGAGAPPSRAPSTWPGTRTSIRAGWRTWTSMGQG